MDLNIRCLVDTGSMVSTITETFYRKYIEPLGKMVNPTCHLQLKAANGLVIPYIGYIELDVNYNGNIIPQRGFLIVKDSSDDATRKRKESVPGIIGMNILGACTDILGDVRRDGNLSEVFVSSDLKQSLFVVLPEYSELYQCAFLQIPPLLFHVPDRMLRAMLLLIL